MIVLIIKILSSKGTEKNNTKKKNALKCFIALVILTVIEFIVAYTLN